MGRHGSVQNLKSPPVTHAARTHRESESETDPSKSLLTRTAEVCNHDSADVHSTRAM